MYIYRYTHSLESTIIAYDIANKLVTTVTLLYIQ